MQFKTLEPRSLPIELLPLVAEMKAVGKKSPVYEQFPMIVELLSDHQRRINQMGVTIKALEFAAERIELRSGRRSMNGRY